MDGAVLSPFPHHVWLGFPLEMRQATTSVLSIREVTHTIALGTSGAAHVRWIHRGRELEVGVTSLL